MYLQGYCGPAHSQGQYTTCIGNERKCSLRMFPTAYSGHLSEGEKGQIGRCNTHNMYVQGRDELEEWLQWSTYQEGVNR